MTSFTYMERKCFEKCFWENSFSLIGHYIKKISQNIFAPFNWKLFKLGSVKGIRKNVFIFQGVGSTPAPPTQSVFRLDLLHTDVFVWRFFPSNVSHEKANIIRCLNFTKVGITKCRIEVRINTRVTFNKMNLRFHLIPRNLSSFSDLPKGSWLTRSLIK